MSAPASSGACRQRVGHMCDHSRSLHRHRFHSHKARYSYVKQVWLCKTIKQWNIPLSLSYSCAWITGVMTNVDIIDSQTLLPLDSQPNEIQYPPPTQITSISYYACVPYSSSFFAACTLISPQAPVQFVYQQIIYC